VKYFKKIAVTLNELRKATKELLKREKLFRGGMILNSGNPINPILKLVRKPLYQKKETILPIGPVTWPSFSKQTGEYIDKAIFTSGQAARLLSRMSKQVTFQN
jgi:hypothetical protein